MLIGGVSCASRDVARIDKDIQQIRATCKFPNDGLEWKKVNYAKLKTFTALVDYFCEMNEEKIIDFGCLVIDTSKLKHKEFNDGSGETFFQKMISECVRTKVRLYGKPNSIRVVHGRREFPEPLTEIKRLINAKISKQNRSLNPYMPLRMFEIEQVSENNMLQLADVLLGCTAYYWNTKLQKNPESAKSQLAKHAHSEIPVYSLALETPYWQKHLDIWELRLERSKA